MEALLLAIAQRFRRELETVSAAERVAGVADVVGVLYSTPLALLGLAWLVYVTDLGLFSREWPTLSVLFLLILLFEWLPFFIYLDIKGLSFNAEGSLSGIVAWSGALLFGPSALWLPALARSIGFIRDWRDTSSAAVHWSHLRSFTLREAGLIPTGLFALALYERWGGAYPLPSLSLDAIQPALYSTIVGSLLAVVLHLPFVLYIGKHTAQLTQGAASMWSLVQVASVGLVLPALVAPFGVLAAGLHTQNGLGVFLLFTGGLLLGSLLTRQLSQAVERSQQRSRELEQLEQLGRAILSAPPDASSLPELLQAHVPGMFPASQVEIRRFSNQILVRFPEPDDLPPVPAAVWDWLRTTTQARYFLANEVRPWENSSQEQHQFTREPLVIAPVLDAETAEPIGGVYVAPRRDITDVASLMPAVQSLAAQISSTLHSAQIYAKTLAHQRVQQELALAGEIQASFLPDTLPEVPGWQLAVTLEPARQTSGDFYDVIPLPNGRLGIVVADVADKGTGAALFMALSRTLIRTYAVEHHTRPDFALRVANNRILSDAHVDLFVTVFYGVLDPLTGRFTYCNAGHNPPILLKAQGRPEVQQLTGTGLPLGIFRGQTWEHRTVQIDRGDVLVLYTDGITEAQNDQETFFGESRLLAVAEAHQQDSAQELRAAIMREIQTFVGDAPQFDDIAIVVLVREA